MMTLGPDAKMGTSITCVTEHGIDIDAQGDGDNDITVVNSETIYAAKHGITVLRSGAGDIEIEHRVGTIDATESGMLLSYSETSELGTGIGDIMVTTMKDSVIKGGKHGINPVHRGAESDITVIHDGSISAGNGSVGILATNFTKDGNGSVTIAMGENSEINSKENNGTSGINASVRNHEFTGNIGGPTGGSVTVTHKRTTTSKGQGIYVTNRKTGTSNTGGLIVTPEEDSMITADGDGIEAEIWNDNSSGDITITHNGKITAKGNGIETGTRGTGDVTVTTEENSMISADKDGISAAREIDDRDVDAGDGDIMVTHDGSIAADQYGIYASIWNSLNGNVVVIIGKNSKIDIIDDDNSYSDKYRAGVFALARDPRNDSPIGGSGKHRCHPQGHDEIGLPGHSGKQ